MSTKGDGGDSPKDLDRRDYLKVGVGAGIAAVTSGLLIDNAQAQPTRSTRPAPTVRRQTTRPVGQSSRIRFRRADPRIAAPAGHFSRKPSPSLQRQPQIQKLIGRILAEPNLVERLWRDPQGVAKEVGMTLSSSELAHVKRLPNDVKKKVQQWAKEVQLRPPDGP